MPGGPGLPNRFQCPEFWPVAGWLFEVDVGRGCEPLRLAQCRYPAAVRLDDRELSTRMDRGWRFSGFSKTQYASLHGWEHFRRCHCDVVEFLAARRPLGFRVEISDEGDYRLRRCIAAVRREVDQMNRFVAALAGGLKDGADGAQVESPIFRHQEFERLEAEGATKLGRLGAALKAVDRELSRRRT